MDQKVDGYPSDPILFADNEWLARLNQIRADQCYLISLLVLLPGILPSEFEEVLLALSVVGHLRECEREYGHQEHGEQGEQDALVATGFADNDRSRRGKRRTRQFRTHRKRNTRAAGGGVAGRGWVWNQQGVRVIRVDLESWSDAVDWSEMFQISRPLDWSWAHDERMSNDHRVIRIRILTREFRMLQIPEFGLLKTRSVSIQIRNDHRWSEFGVIRWGGRCSGISPNLDVIGWDQIRIKGPSRVTIILSLIRVSCSGVIKDDLTRIDWRWSIRNDRRDQIHDTNDQKDSNLTDLTDWSEF